MAQISSWAASISCTASWPGKPRRPCHCWEEAVGWEIKWGNVVYLGPCRSMTITMMLRASYPSLLRYWVTCTSWAFPERACIAIMPARSGSGDICFTWALCTSPGALSGWTQTTLITNYMLLCYLLIKESCKVEVCVLWGSDQIQWMRRWRIKILIEKEPGMANSAMVGGVSFNLLQYLLIFLFRNTTMFIALQASEKAEVSCGSGSGCWEFSGVS